MGHGRMKFYFPDPTPPRENFLGEIFLCHDGVFPGPMKFHFPDPTPQRENFLGEIFLGHDGVFPGQMKFYFLEPYPPMREFPWCDFPWSGGRIPWPEQV